MPMLRAIPVLLLIFLAWGLPAQDSLYDNRVCVKVAPLAIFDIYSGMSPRAGVEFKLKSNHALYHEAGTYIPYANGMHNNVGVLTKLEYKLYIHEYDVTSGNYVSVELFYKHQTYGTYDSIRVQPFYSKNYRVEKDVGCFTLKYGDLKVYKRGMVVDMFIGIGLRYKSIRNSLTGEENDHIQPAGDYGFNISKNKAGNRFSPNFDIGIKIGYSFK